MGKGEGELGNPVLVALSLGQVGVEHSILAVAAHAQDLVVRRDTRRHALHDFAGRIHVRQDKKHEREKNLYTTTLANQRTETKVRGRGEGGRGLLRVVVDKLKIKNISRCDSFVDYRAGAAVVERRTSHLLEKTNGRALASVNNRYARLGRSSGRVEFPQSVKLGDVIVSFLQNLLGAVEASAVNDDCFGKVAVVSSCVCTHSAVKKGVDVAGVLVPLHMFETTGEELAGVVGVGGNASKRTRFVNRHLGKINK